MIVESYHVIHRPYDQHWARHSLGDASQQCAQMTQPDSARVPLGLALVGGHCYFVFEEHPTMRVQAEGGRIIFRNNS
jgi:hypothetical protein